MRKRRYTQYYYSRRRRRRPRKIFAKLDPRIWVAVGGAAVVVLLTVLICVGTSEGGFLFSASREEAVERPENQEQLTVLDGGELKEMGLEDYLVGVVAAEMPASYESEALKAQAVAARTYTLRKMQHSGCNKDEQADICTDSGHCQAYADEARLKERWGRSFKKNLQKVKNAVYSTAGEVLTYQGGVIDAMYHASSGGHTEDSENVYKNKIDYLRGVESPDAEGYEKEVSYTLQEFADRMKEKLGVSLNTASPDLEILSHYDSGRVKEIRVGGEVFSGTKFRGAAGLPSAVFSFELRDGSIFFEVKGYGHGVGMSQSGANYYAKQEGWDYEQILLHYYTGVTLEKN